MAAGVPLLGAPSLADSSAEAIDGSTLSFLLQRALEVKREEEEAVEVAELTELEEKVVAAEDGLLRELEKDWAKAIRVTTQSWPTLSRVGQLAILWFLAKDKVVKRREKRKKKKEEENDEVDSLARVWVPVLLLCMTSLTILSSFLLALFDWKSGQSYVGF